MTIRKKIFLWIGLVFSLFSTGYAGGSFIFYIWLSAAKPERWSANKVAVWAYSALAMTILFIALFVYCLMSLIKEANRKYREEQHESS